MRKNYEKNSIYYWWNINITGLIIGLIVLVNNKFDFSKFDNVIPLCNDRILALVPSSHPLASVDKAPIKAFEKAISINADYAAGYRMLGYCQSLKKMKKEAKANYEKAKALGDTVVDQLLEKL